MRKSLAATVIALAVIAPSAVTTATATAASSHSVSAHADQKAKKAKKAKKVKVKFVHHGALTAVSVDSLTFTVHGGPNKALRGMPLTVAVTASTKVVRDDFLVTLADLVVGDHVNVKGTKIGGVYTATRISAESPAPVPVPVVVP